ncbi:hypothetical protein K9M79_06835 [Candidatus Woesearchaeota archaeon]|nr:hypothetical protein [Candidatus Woesearchaeota archaeon]
MNHPKVATLIIDAMGLDTLEFLLDSSIDPISLPNLESMGLGNLVNARYHDIIRPHDNPQFACTLTQDSAEADSVIGHREMMGIIDSRKYKLFFDGFPPEYISELETRIGTKTIFNQMAGGTDAIERNHEEHMKTSYPIVYPSICDPLIQIAMNEAKIPVERAHQIADIAYELAQEQEIKITRSIARTYIEKDGEIIRTGNRYDRVLPIGEETLIDVLGKKGVYLVSVGKCAEMVPSEYWNEKLKYSDPSVLDPTLKFVHPKNKDTNPFSVQGTIDALESVRSEYGTYIMSNFSDTDSVFGHTQDVAGSLRSVQEFDRVLPIIYDRIRDEDVLIVTADHGMLHAGNGTPGYQDYGYHNKERLPLLAVRKNSSLDVLVPTNTLAGVGYLVADVLGVKDMFEVKRVE